MSAGERNQRIWGLQYLRAIAALMVVACHFVITYEPELGGPRVYWLLNHGVDIFFVISGFVMMTSGADLSPGEFVGRRLARIVPLYWLLTTVVVVRALLAPHRFANVQISWPYYLKSLLFIPFNNPAAGNEMKPIACSATGAPIEHAARP
jgi:peptidoglycan/LPS O-acetylase OafA/YrhL